MKNTELKRKLITFAGQIGLDHLGFASAESFEAEADRLHELADEGMYPPFAERDIALRRDPAAWLPGAKTLIAAAICYLTDDAAKSPMPGAPRGWLSRYGWGADYHAILKDRLERLGAYLSTECPGAQWRAYVDTGPPLDRAVAARAGIGWFGKNTMFYVPKHGSWVFLGEIVTDVEIVPDPPLDRSCGTCTKCVQACPTGAIIAPFKINAARCLSTITQMGGFIPVEYRRAMGRRLWGCDVCQEACPWNWEAQASNRPEFRPTVALGARPELIPLLTMTKAQFKEWFGPTAMAWRGKAVLQRNAAICLGNIKDPQAVPALVDRLLHDPKPVLRGTCAWALGEIGGPEAKEALIKAASREKHPEVLQEIEAALAAL